MPALHEIQREFSRYLLGGPDDRLSAAIRFDRMESSRRAQIYRNHLGISLAEALGATFPTAARLVGPDYFAAAARRFIAAHPPTQPVLAEYGAEFPSFLETLPHAPEYLGDVARLEWAMNLSCNAPDADVLNAAELAARHRDDLRLKPHPASRLLASAYPVHLIWAANRLGDDADGTVDLSEGGVALLIWRRGGDVLFRALDRATHRFIAALFAGGSLTGAASLALTADPLFDLAGALAGLLKEPIFSSQSA